MNGKLIQQIIDEIKGNPIARNALRDINRQDCAEFLLEIGLVERIPENADRTNGT